MKANDSVNAKTLINLSIFIYVIIFHMEWSLDHRGDVHAGNTVYWVEINI